MPEETAKVEITQIQAVRNDGTVIWSCGLPPGHRESMSSRAYRSDGTLPAIISALKTALAQAEGDLSLANL